MRTRIVLALALLGSLSCAQGPSRIFSPAVSRGVHIDLALVASAASGSSAEPVTITAIIQNLGRESVDIPNRCPEPTIRLYDVSGGELFQRDPTMPYVCTAEASRPFQPGERYDVPLTFDGGYYAGDGRRLDAPAGTYKAIATFVYIDGPEVRALTREVVFAWQ